MFLRFMKNLRATFIAFWKSYTSLFLIPIILFVALRIVEYCILIENLQSLHNPFRSFTYSVEFDLIFIAFYYLSFFLLFFILYLVSKRLYYFTFLFLLVVLSFIYLALNQFFYTSDLLLDKTVFFFNWRELQIILGGESGGVLGAFFWLYLAAIVVLVLGIWVILPKLKKNRKVRIVAQILTIVCLCLLLFRGESHPKPLHQYSHYETQLHTSKMTYFFSSLGNLFFDESLNTEAKLDYIKTYRKMVGRENYFEKLELPFVYPVNELKKNDWSNYIDQHDKVENVVFIIAEGLSSRFSGEDARFGSMTPFLDSLSKKSLYWPNMLSITDRTHGIFAASLAGLSHGFERGFLNYTGKKPSYISLPRILKKQGYSLNFIYGGWSYFDNYHSFLKQNAFDSIVNEDYIQKYFNLKRSSSENEFSWGIHDHATVDAYFQFMNSHKSPSPYFNIYLTLSLHTPYDIPKKSFYIEKSKKALPHISTEFFEANKDVISTVYYADHSLQRFFKEYSKREDFKETIFVIMGDHSVKAMDLHSELGTYHVPFILYSPKIKKPQKFNEIISHWDFPAILFDVLPSLNWSAEDDLTHWLGEGVSFSDDLSAEKPIFLGTFKGEITGVVWNEYALIHDRLYKIKDGLELELYEDAEITLSMSKLLKTYIWLNRYSIENDKIITQKEASKYFIPEQTN